MERKTAVRVVMARHNPQDVEKYRQRFECDEHWKFRRDFILRHYGHLSENRLLCLSQVLVNVKLLGCRYPDPVMRRIEEMSQGVEQPEKKQVAKFRAVSFVKASECRDPRIGHEEAARLGCRKRECDVPDAPPAKIRARQTPEERPQIEAFLAKLRRVGALARSGDVSGASVLERLHEASQKAKMKLSYDVADAGLCGFRCSVFLDGVWLAEGTARSKKDSRQRAYEAAWEKVKERSHRVEANPEGRPELRVEADYPLAVPDVRAVLPNFVLLLSGNWQEHASNSLFIAASLNKVSCAYDFDVDGPGSVNCRVLLEGVEVGRGTGETRRAAKHEASAASLDFLRTRVPTVLVKTPVDGGGEELTRETMAGERRNGAISEDNVGHRLLTMMGWCGGGVGKEGTGIVEPVLPRETVGRSGLGFAKKMDRAFREKVQAVLRGFASKVVLKDLVFSPEFDAEERKFVHGAARHLGLKSVSRNGPEGRFLTIRHKLSPTRLLEEILRLGSTEKYEVLMP